MKKIILTVFVFLFAAVFLSGCGPAKEPVKPVEPVKKGITMETVAGHNLPSDCWLVINNNIYNLTDYISNHPGGENKITNYCGKEATAAFDTKNKESAEAHSDTARTLLEKFYIGDLAR